MKQSDFVQLYTVEGERLLRSGEIPWTDYPRPHLKRDSFFCLNGEWDFAVTKKGTSPVSYPERIRVPFAPESVLSGIGRTMPKGAELHYSRRFTLPASWCGGRVLLHFGAVDQIARVSLNGLDLMTHRGGYAPFSFDVTDCLAEENVLHVTVTDELDNHVLPYGKQKRKRGGMWYTPISGIWQTVWMELVPEDYIQELQIVSYADRAELRVVYSGDPACQGTVCLHDGAEERVFPLRNGKAILTVSDPILWSPETPHLYSITVRLGEDTVSSYFALRSLEIREVKGIPRLCLNGQPYFFHGLLDQGYFCDGIFLPASAEGFERDILLAKKFGFNMLRKHIKVEPEVFYYACDRLGIVVCQDMVNNGAYSFLRDTALPTVGFKRKNDRRIHRDPKTREAFLSGMEETVRRLSFHPSVCAWTIFNEGWGQFDHAEAYRRLKEIDSTRFVDSVSGWFLPRGKEAAVSDVESPHVYFKPICLESARASGKPIVLSEFGGYAHKVEGHSFNPVKTYGYRFFSEAEAFENALEELYRKEIVPAIKDGLCAAVYTQLTDVEDETNGLVTYDRRVEKVHKERMRQLASLLRIEKIEK